MADPVILWSLPPEMSAADRLHGIKVHSRYGMISLRLWSFGARARVESYGRAAARAYGIANALEEMPRAMMPRGLRGWIAKRFATRLFVTMQRDWRGFTTVQAVRGLLAAAADGRRGSGAGGGHHRRGRSLSATGFAPGPGPICAAGWRSALRQDLPPLEHDPGSTADGIFPPEGAPEPPAKGRRSAGALQKRGLRDILKATAAAHPDKRLQLWFQDEARVGNKEGMGAGCVTGGGAGASVPPGRVKSATSGPTSSPPCAPDTGDDVTLVMPSVNAKVMDLFLAHFADTLDQDAHAVMMWRHQQSPATVGTTSAPSPSPTTSPWRCCRLTVPNSTARRAGLALPTRSCSTLPIAPRPRRHRGHHRRLLPSMDRPHRRTGSYANPLRLSMDHEGRARAARPLVLFGSPSSTEFERSA